MIDALRILIPGYIGLGSFDIGIFLLYQAFVAWGWEALFWVAPLEAFGIGIAAILVTCGLKWLVMGRFKPVLKPLGPYMSGSTSRWRRHTCSKIG